MRHEHAQESLRSEGPNDLTNVHGVRMPGVRIHWYLHVNLGEAARRHKPLHSLPPHGKTRLRSGSSCSPSQLFVTHNKKPGLDDETGNGSQPEVRSSLTHRSHRPTVPRPVLDREARATTHRAPAHDNACGDAVLVAVPGGKISIRHGVDSDVAVGIAHERYSRLLSGKRIYAMVQLQPSVTTGLAQEEA